MKKLLAAALLFAAMPVEAAMNVEIPILWDPPTENIDGTPLTDLAGYNIYYKFSSTGGYTQSVNVQDPLATTSVLSLSSIQSGTTVYIVMTAYDFEGNESVFSNQIAKGPFTEVDALAPGAPVLQAGPAIITNCPTGQLCTVANQ